MYSAVPIDNTDGEWSTNGASFMHSHQHGFGVLDAYRLTRSAQVRYIVTDHVTVFYHVTLRCGRYCRLRLNGHQMSIIQILQYHTHKTIN